MKEKDVEHIRKKMKKSKKKEEFVLKKDKFWQSLCRGKSDKLEHFAGEIDHDV